MHGRPLYTTNFGTNSAEVRAWLWMKAGMKCCNSSLKSTSTPLQSNQLPCNTNPLKIYQVLARDPCIKALWTPIPLLNKVSLRLRDELLGKWGNVPMDLSRSSKIVISQNTPCSLMQLQSKVRIMSHACQGRPSKSKTRSFKIYQHLMSYFQRKGWDVKEAALVEGGHLFLLVAFLVGERLLAPHSF